MPEELEWKTSRRGQARKCVAIMLAGCALVCLSRSLFAVEADDAPPAQSTAAETAVVTPRKKTLDTPRDFGADLVEKIEAQANVDDKAAVVDVAEHDLLPQSKGKWTISHEEITPHISVTTPIVRKAVDPEWVRAFPDDDENSDNPPAPGAAARAKRLKKVDPERLARWTEDDAEDRAQKVAAPLASSGLRRPYLDSANDAPRFASGGGLDSDAAEIVSNLALKEKDETETAAVEPPAKAAPEKAATPDAKKAVASKEKDPVADALIDKLASGNAKKPTGKKKNGKKDSEPEDPEARFNALIAQIDRNKKLLEIAKQSQEKSAPPSPEETATARRGDPHARNVLEILKNNTPTGTVAGVVTDATGKQLVAARVRITDATETAVDASLPEGFWCEGRFTARVISGPVKVEVFRGRFSAPHVEGVQVKPGTSVPVDFALNKPTTLNFAAQGWYLADLDMGLRLQPGERSVWMGAPPTLQDLTLAAQAEGVQILGVPLPLNNPELAKEILAQASTDPANVLVLPAFPGPRHAFHGTAYGLGVTSWQGLAREGSLPEVPLRDGLEEIRARGGLAVFKDLTGQKTVDLRRDILALLPRLEQTNYFGRTNGNVRLYASNELAFDTVTGPAYDAIAFDGSPAAMKLWFNLLNHSYQIAAIGAAGGSLEGGRIPFGQTFINVDGKPTRDKVLEALKNGRTSISFGPAAFCKISERDKGPGSILPADGRSLTLQVQAYASLTQGAQLDKIEIVRNGEIVHTQTASDGEAAIHGLNWPVSETTDAWYMVRVTEKRNTGTTTVPGGSAWTSPIYFRGAAYAAPTPVISKISGRLRKGLTPTPGTVTAVVPGTEPRQVATDAQGNYSLTLPSSGSLIFTADGCEPQALRVFEHPAVQRGMGALVSESRGSLEEQFANPTLFPAWKLLLSELEWNITLNPSVQLSPSTENADTPKAPATVIPTPGRNKVP
jgi:hypothetical protein